MSEERTTLEVIGQTVEEALQDGLSQLGVSENQVDVEILDEGAKSMLGLGGRQARIRISIKEDAVALPRSIVAPREETRDDYRIDDEDDEDSDGSLYEDTEVTYGFDEVEGEVQNTMAIARETVRELLDKMSVNADVSVRLGEPDEVSGHPPIYVNINGNDLSYLIGQRAETLNALQYITRLIVGKEIGEAAYIVVDVEGYRSRREQNLRNLAERMARQAVSTGATQTLEPMNPADRRIVHLALRDYDGISTESVGEGTRRKVTIIPDED
jgi:spoIIIJ-associated protein